MNTNDNEYVNRVIQLRDDMGASEVTAPIALAGALIARIEDEDADTAFTVDDAIDLIISCGRKRPDKAPLFSEVKDLLIAYDDHKVIKSGMGGLAGSSRPLCVGSNADLNDYEFNQELALSAGVTGTRTSQRYTVTAS